MDLNRLRVIGGKELLDHLMDSRFLLIVGVLFLVVIIGLIGGLISYSQSVERYASAVSVVGDQSSADDGAQRGGSLLVVLDAIAGEIMVLGAILGIAMGFDLITKEKEGGSLKLLLSHPIYRDEAINGKGLGGIAAIALVVVVTFTILLGILFLFGIVPNGFETFSILILAITSFLLIFSYFSISLLMSATCPTGGTALIAPLIIFIFLSALMPMFVDPSVVSLFIGKAPEPPSSGNSVASQGFGGEKSDEVDVGSIAAGFNINDIIRYQEEMSAFEGKRMALEGFISLFSPTLNFQQVMTKLETSTDVSGRTQHQGTSGVTGDSNGPPGEAPASIPRALETTMPNLVALMIFPIMLFGIAYARFMRLDIR